MSETTTVGGGDGDAVVAAVLATGPGPWAAAQLAGLPLSRVSEPVRPDLLRAWAAQEAWTQARAAAVLAEHLGPAPTPDPDSTRYPETATDAGLGWRMRLGEAALALRVSPQTLRNRHVVAHDLATRLPATRAALEAGALSWVHALVVSDATALLPDDQARAVDQAVMTRAGQPLTGHDVPTPAALRRRMRRAVIKADPDAALARARQAHQCRGVRVWSEPDGGGHLEAWSDHRDTWTLKQALDLLAGPREANDPRALGARRYDALLGAVLGAVAPTDPEVVAADDHDGGDSAQRKRRRRRRRRAGIEVQVVIDLATLAGMADRPGYLPGYGPIPPGLVHDWLADATTWRRLVTDPVTGHLLDYGTAVRFPPADLAAYLKARDTCCVFPDCAQPATSCDADHHPPWRDDGTGGSTSASDMAMVCRQHHNWLTHGGWRLDHLPDGSHRFTSPTGRTFHTRPPPVLPTDE